MTDFTGLRILIVGGGLAGLSLAIALRQRGLIPDIIERASEFSTRRNGSLHRWEWNPRLEAPGI